MDFVENVKKLIIHQDRLLEVDGEINKKVLKYKCNNLTSPLFLESYTSLCKDVCDHMKILLENKDKLLDHLQQPLISNYLTVQYNYHRELKEALLQLANLFYDYDCCALPENISLPDTIDKMGSHICTMIKLHRHMKLMLADVVRVQNCITSSAT